jgi:hypothetical protein
MAGLFAAGGTAQAQGIFPLAVEARGAFAMPQGEWNDGDEIGNGFGYGINGRLQVFPLISIYGGWDRYSFDVESDGDGDSEATDTGLHAGGYISLPLSAVTGLSPFAFAGVVYNSTDLAFSSGGVTISAESDDGLGYEVGAGLAIPFAPTLSLTPAVRYRSHNAEFPSITGEDGELTVSYISFDLGLKLGL